MATTTMVYLAVRLWHSLTAGTYVWSYSWFELSLLRAGREVPGSRHLVQFNVVCKCHLRARRRHTAYNRGLGG